MNEWMNEFKHPFLSLSHTHTHTDRVTWIYLARGIILERIWAAFVIVHPIKMLAWGKKYRLVSSMEIGYEEMCFVASSDRKKEHAFIGTLL
jgi:hypothetical protein